MSTLSDRIAQAKKSHGIAVLPFIAAGYPDLDTSMQLLPALDKAGAAGAEVGFPFSDPIADGPIIQAAFTEALKHGLKVDQIFDGVAATRSQHALPLFAMVSFSIVYRYGVDAFVKKAKQSGFAATIIPDLPPPEAEETCKRIGAGGLETIMLISPSTPAKRRDEIARLCTGFIYYLSIAGITGERDKLPPGIEANVRAIKQITDRPVCVGFGISKPEHVRQLSGIADGVIVGSGIVRRIKDSKTPVADVQAYCAQLVAAE